MTNYARRTITFRKTAFYALHEFSEKVFKVFNPHHWTQIHVYANKRIKYNHTATVSPTTYSIFGPTIIVVRCRIRV